MNIILRLRGLSGWVLAAVLLAAGYEYARAWPLAIFGAAVFLRRAWYAKRPVEAFFGGWCAGAIFFALISRWLFAVWPAEWLGLERDPAVLPLIFAAWLILAASVGVTAGFLGAAIFWLRHLPATWFLFAVPSAWVIAEYLRAWIFSLVSWGSGALVGPHWTFGHLGYALVDSPFFRLAQTIGVYGLSWMLVFFAAALFAAFRAYRMNNRRMVRQTGIVLAAIAVLALVGIAAGNPRDDGEPFSVVVAQSDTRQGPLQYREAMREAIASFLRDNPDASPDLVVLPEDAQLFAISENEERELLGRFFPDAGKSGMVVTNATVTEDGKRVKYTLYVDRAGELIGRQPKTFLIPGGEIMPSVVAGMLRLAGRNDFLEMFNERRLMSVAPPRRITRGELYGAPPEPKFIAFGTTKLSAAVCSGVLSSKIYREFARSGAEILINQTSFSVFHGSPILLAELTRMARFRAAENARPLVQSANAGYSMVIDASGNVTARPAALGNYLIAATVTPRRVTTPTQRFGDWPVGASLIILLAAFVCCGGRNRTSFSGL